MSEVKMVSMQELGPILEQTVQADGRAEITVTGRSMLPLLLDRVSRVRLVKVDIPQRGDMVLYRRDNGTYVLHRIMRCHSDGSYTMCGDGQTVPEPGLRREQLIAKVESFARRSTWRNCTQLSYRLWWRIHLLARPLRHQWARGVRFLRRVIHKIISAQ